MLLVGVLELSTGSPFEPGRTLRSSGVELELSSDVKVELDLFEFSEEEQVFLAREFPEAAYPETARDEGFLMLVALGPVKAKLCPPAKLTVPNSRNLDPGTELSIYAHSTDVEAEFAPYGEWAPVSDATVSEDGQTIVTDAGQGLPFLSVIGIK